MIVFHNVVSHISYMSFTLHYPTINASPSPPSLDTRINIWTENEWKSLINFAHLVPVIGIAFSVFTLIFLCWNMQDIDKNYPFFVFTLLSFVSSLCSTVVSEGWGDEERFCESNAVPFSQEYGYSVCTVQAAIMAYCLQACCVCLLMTAIHICIYTSPHTHILTHPAYYTLQFLCVFGIPIIFVGIIGNYESFGFARSQPWCYVLPPSADPLYLDYKLTGLPIFICTLICIGVLIMHSIAFNTCHVKSRPYFVSRVHIEHPTEDDGEGGILCVAETQKCSKDRKIAALELPTYPEQITNFEEDQVVDVGSPREEDDEHMRRANPRTLSSQSNNSHTPIPYDNLHIRPLPPLISTHNPPNMLRYKLFVLVVCIIIFIPYFASKLSAMRTVGENRDAYAEFTQCVFQNYRGDDEDWETACGDHPSIRPSSSGVLFLCVALCGSMIIVGPLMLFCLGLDLCLKSGEKSKSIFEDN
ncbi:hypothetical protein EON65_23560 [archaeon]|nr:MAG: hypothetical protein EON65_23560 [archaeon]